MDAPTSATTLTAPGVWKAYPIARAALVPSVATRQQLSPVIVNVRICAESSSDADRSVPNAAPFAVSSARVTVL